MASTSCRDCNVAKKTASPPPETSQTADALLDELMRLLARIAAREHVAATKADTGTKSEQLREKLPRVRPRNRGPPRE